MRSSGENAVTGVNRWVLLEVHTLNDMSRQLEAMLVPGGCLVRSLSIERGIQYDMCAESMTFVPNVTIDSDARDGARLIAAAPVNL